MPGPPGGCHKLTVPGDGTKFRDYLLSVGLEDQEPGSLPTGTVVTERHARDAQQLPRRDIDLDALAAAAPFDIVQDWQRRLT